MWYRGEDAAEKIISELQRKAEEICAEYIETPQEMEFTSDDEVHFECAQVCHICQQILVDENDRVRDHCHLTGTYRGVAHNACNLNYRLNPKSWKLPIVMHNLKGYNGHLIVRALKSEFGKVSVIPQNMGKYLSITVGRLKFIDSFQFTPKSLNVLSKALEDDEFKYLIEAYTTSHFALIRREGVYPYDHMDSFKRLEETELPSQDAFFNKLSGDSCSDSDCAHANRVWDAFGCETMGDDVYLQLDVLLLADFFEKFRCTCLNYYSLDPLHYYTTPGLAWDAALSVDLQLITNVDIYNMLIVLLEAEFQ